MNKVIEEFDKFVQDNINFYLQNDAYKVHVFKIPNNNEKDKKNYQNEYTYILEKVFDVLYIKHPITTLSIIAFLIFLYTIIILIFKNFSFDEINSNDLLLLVYVILAFVSAVYIFLAIVLLGVGFFTTKLYRGIKVFIGGVSLFIMIIGSFMTIKYFYDLLNNKELSKTFLTNPVINLYIESKGYPKFAVLHTKKGDKLEFIIYVNNGFIYYQNICDVDHIVIQKLKSKSKNNFLSVIDFYNEIYNKVLYAINIRNVKELRKIRTGIPFKLFDSYYKKQCKSRKNKE